MPPTSTDAQFIPPRKKHNVLWWVGGFVVLLVVLFFFQLFGPNPPIVVSPQTTYITQPLGLDGLPDFEQHILNLSREGVTPDNNAVALLWPALFPADVQPQHFAAMATELGIDRMPAEDEALVRLHSNAVRQQLATWLVKQFESQTGDASLADPNDDGSLGGESGELTRETIALWSDSNSPLAEELLNQTMKRPWTGDQLPPLGQWVRENEVPLEMIVEASRRPRYYAPSPTLLDNQRNLLIEMLLPVSQSVRDAGRALSARAMWNLGEGRADDAWRDLLALYRISHLATQGHTLVEQLVAIAMSGLACDGTVTLLHHGKLNVEQARQVQRDLAAWPSFAVMARSLDQTERAAALNAFVRVGSGGGGEMFSALSGVQDNDFGNNAFNVISVDWNFVLRETNRWYDRLAAAAALPDRPARSVALATIEADVQQLVADARAPANWAAGVVSRQQRSKLVSSIMLGLFLPAVNAATDAEDRANAILELTRLAAALAVYRAEHGAYPEKLDDLMPGVLEKLPVDLYNAKPFVYKRDDTGYLLYGLGENGVDDGGSNERLHLHKGQPLDELSEAERNNLLSPNTMGTDDMSIRVPRPAFTLPSINSATTEP